ncbi:Uncharacterized conserved protein YbbC, DUF1343 family [Candidatus Thermokryptus mobilis]|uniref:Uncharacterized conserved protein YbbC, DUF1343 family n=1 Tax=Candidatus Thermokryptus mobilis TaxID=1643428 RepID=A0A0S4NB23_9BACT|nr:DUF1343 domain-containing protein [Candidatus Thermokryptus mobilis]CUU07699.1 Uncharacterized conserved protein YbbC, DUF1343 family [Candidatus Thermokryptus mobilis]
MRKFIVLNLIAITLAFSQQSRVKIGAEILIEKHLDLIKGKKIGIVTNHTGILPDGRHIVDVLNEIEDVKVVALFGPEHGIRGEVPDGKSISHGVDTKTGIPVFSLYGEVKKPTTEMLKDIDVLIFDIQDVGARFYTYISTMSYCMEACAEMGKKFIVLDRPNPVRGVYVDGPILEPRFKSFVGLHPIPVAHGMTVGELAKMFNEEAWLENGMKADLTVIKMENYSRKLWFDQTGLPWIKPSPNMMTLKTAIVYTATCFIEGTNVSEGRGTQHPFEWIGAPWIDGSKLANELNSYNLPGVRFEPISFIPTDIEKVTVDPKYEGERCGGIYLNVYDREKFEPVKVGVYILYALKKLYPDKFKWRTAGQDRLWGTDKIRLMIDEGKKPEEIIKTWESELKKFLGIRQKYLLYN